MKNIIRSLFASGAFLLIACGSGGSGGDGGDSGKAPVAAALLAPANNTECLTATSISETESKVTFQWEAAENTDSYILFVKNLTSGITFQYNPGPANTFDVTLEKGVPYSWSVTSKSESATKTASSEKWKFYNAGNGAVSYAPFPAEVIAPLMSSTISGTTVDLKWNTSDVDSDIVNYSVYFGTNPNPTTLLNTVTTNAIIAVPVSSGTSYYWKVVTKDATGNSSESPIFQFKTS